MPSNPLLTRISAKLSLLMGGALLAGSAQAAQPITPIQNAGSNTATVETTAARKASPAQLILKQKRNGFRMIAAHGSHSSHSSHGSHSSHSSHSSRSI